MKRRTGLKKAQQGCPGKSPGTAASGGQAGWMPVSAHAVFLRGTPPGVASIMMAGLLTRGSWPSPPSRCSAPVAYRGWLPLTVAGAVADSAPDGYSSPHSLFTRSEPRPTREPSPPEMPPNAAEVNCRLRGAKAFWRSSVLRAALHVALEAAGGAYSLWFSLRWKGMPARRTQPGRPFPQPAQPRPRAPKLSASGARAAVAARPINGPCAALLPMPVHPARVCQ